MRWLREAAQHAKELDQVLLKDFRLKRAQIDGLWTFVQNKGEKNYPETAESGSFWISTLIDMDSRLRAAHGVGKDETEASLKVFQTLQQRGHPDGPPPLISDGWGGIDEAMLAVYGLIPQYSGHGRPPSQPKPGKDWRYLQMVKHRDEHGRLVSIEMKAIWGKKSELIELLGKSTACIERDNLTTRLFNAHLTRKTLAFSKDLALHEAAVTWEDAYYNLVRPHKGLRLRNADGLPSKWTPQTPAMVAGLTDHIWSVKDLLLSVPLPKTKYTC